MLDLKFIRESSDIVAQNIRNKNEKADVGEILAFDERRRSIITEVEKLKNQRNIVSKEIAVLKKDKLDAEEKIAAMKEVSDKIKELDDETREIEEKQIKLLLTIPNMVHVTVPVGRSAEDNVEIRRWGQTVTEKPEKDHIQISKELGILDFERGAKVSGAGFAYYVGKGAALERALINFFLDSHTANGKYMELMTPFIVNREAMTGTGQIPKLAEDMYYVDKDELYLIPTAEVPITNFHSGEMLKSEDLPMYYCGYSPCFRREAGSYGKDTRGFLRVHQFNKVELVKFSKPETSFDELELLVQDVEGLLQALNLPYRVILLCSGDTSFSSAKTYDLEVWSPAEQKWLEVSSCSNFTDFQARRAGIRFKPDPVGKPVFVHTLNGSGLATPRILVALIENYYRDGKIVVPEVLRKYCLFDIID